MASPKETAPWTIKGMPVDTRKLALACASKQNLSMAEWVGRAIENQAKLEERNAVLPPEPERLPALYEPPEPLPAIDFAGLTSLVTAAAELLPEDDPSRLSLLRETVRTARAHLRVARGQPASPKRGRGD